MNVPPLNKATDATVSLLPYVAPDGGQVLIAIVKQRFRIVNQAQAVRTGGAEVVLADEPWDPDAPETSSIRLPSDLCLRKPSTDVLLVGEAVAQRRVPVPQLDVVLNVGPIQKTVRVFGTRVWFKGMVGLTLTEPKPLVSLPLRWEFAWGGFDASDPERPLEEPRNPVGRGLVRDPEQLVHQAAPSIEDPRALISNLRSRPAPAGVGALGRHWMPRRKYVGTHDKKWMRERMPLPPLDFDERFNQAAPLDQITPAYLRGGELVLLANVSEEGPMRFSLPLLAFFVGAKVDGKLVEHRPVLDTVVFLPGEKVFDMVWRAVLPVPRPNHRLEYVQVHEKRVL
jgi:hypothetical protein